MKLVGSYLHTTSHHFVANSILNSKLNANQANCAGDAPGLNVTILKSNINDSFFLWSYIYPGIYKKGLCDFWENFLLNY